MLEHIPNWLGSALTGIRAGHEKLTISRLELQDISALRLTSPAFASGGRLPPRFTADGEGVSPPLNWASVPVDTRSLALIVEDPDAPAPRPLVHAIVVDIDPALGGLSEGMVQSDGVGAGGKDVGRNSGFGEGWLPPDPPTGHGSHDYVFQLFALGPAADLNETGASPGRSAFMDHVKSRILAAGVLIGTYSRGEEAAIGPAHAATAHA